MYNVSGNLKARCFNIYEIHDLNPHNTQRSQNFRYRSLDVLLHANQDHMTDILSNHFMNLFKVSSLVIGNGWLHRNFNWPIHISHSLNGSNTVDCF